MVGATGFEPATSCSQSKCSTRLSYAPQRDCREPAPAHFARRRAKGKTFFWEKEKGRMKNAKTGSQESEARNQNPRAQCLVPPCLFSQTRSRVARRTRRERRRGKEKGRMKNAKTSTREFFFILHFSFYLRRLRSLRGLRATCFFRGRGRGRGRG